MMALQVALNQLRHSKDTTVNKKVEKERPAQSESRKSDSHFESATSTVSLFSVDEAELFNFCDEDFLPNDDPFSLPVTSSTTRTSASTSTSTTVTVNTTRGLTLVAGHGRGSNPSLITGVSPHETGTGSKSNESSQSHSEYSPSNKTLKKLQSFKFVKTSNLKSRSVHPKRPPPISDNQSELTPPPNKRRPNVTNWDSPVAGHDDINTSTSEPIFKQPSFNPRLSINSSTHTPFFAQTEGQSSNMGAKVTPTRQTLGGACSNLTVKVATPNRLQPNSETTTSLPSIPVLSSNTPRASVHVHGGISTPQSTVNSSQSRLLTTPQRSIANPVMQTPTRARQTTPLVCTPTGSGVATPIMRASVPLKRKFPGPAGLLPSLAPGQSMDNIYIPPPSTPTPASTPREKRLGFPATPILSSSSSPPPHCAPEDVATFTSSPWTDMMEDLDLNRTSAQSTALLQYNIASSLEQASRKQLRNGKVVHLRAVIKSIIPAGKNASALLKDPTGEVMCTIHSKVVEDHQKELHPGAVLVLRQVSVFSPSPRKHYFNITPTNIVRVYPTNSGEKTSQAPLSLSDVISGEDSEASTSRHSQCSSSMKEFNPTGVKNLNSGRTLSQTSQAQEIGSQASQQRMNSLPGRTNSSMQSSNLQSLTRGAASFLAARKLSSHSNPNTTHSEGSIVTNTNLERVANSNSSSEALLDDLPCDFNDFSDDDNVDSMCTDMEDARYTSLLQDRNYQPAGAAEAPEKMDTSSPDTSSIVRESTTVPKESSFFNKLCEDEFDSLFNDIADDGLDF